MSDIAIVSIFSINITIHEVHNVDIKEDPHFLIARSIDILKAKYGNQFIGVVDNIDNLTLDQIAACVQSVPESSELTEIRIYSCVSGWFNHRTHLVKLGTISFHEVSTVLEDLKNKYAIMQTELSNVAGIHRKEISNYDSRFKQMKTHLEDKLSVLTEENNAFADELQSLRSQCLSFQEQISARDIECKRLIRENANLREAASQDTDTIIKLNNEIGKLRNQCTGGVAMDRMKFDYSIGYSLCDVVNSSDLVEKPKPKTNMPVKSIPDVRYDLCVDAIKNFNKSRLRSIKITTAS